MLKICRREIPCDSVMRAIVIKRYGDPDVLSIEERPDPKPQPGHVLMRSRLSA